MTFPVSNDGGPQSAVVIGGGLAGIAAAGKLAESGWRVTLVEARDSLGGRAFSYHDRQTGRELDNGQHVIVGACHNLIAFFERMGVRRSWHLQRRLDIAVYDRAGRLGRLYGVPAPAPAHLLPAFLTYPHLGLLDKIKAVRGLIAAMRIDRQRDDLDEITFYEWLRAHGQSERNIYNLWNVLIEGTLNDNIRDVSAAMGLMIVQDGMINGRHEANLGYPTVPLGDGVGRPAKWYLENLGVEVLLGCPVHCVNVRRDRYIEHLEAGQDRKIAADAFVSAVPFWVLPNLLPDDLTDLEPFATLKRLEASPIVNVHLRYDRPVMSGDFCYFLDSLLQWVFNGSLILGDHSDRDGQSLTVSISAAWEYIDAPRERLAEIVSEEMLRAFPGAHDANLLDVVVVKQRNATFRCTPGAQRLRPGPNTASPNLFLAGEWTNTGWPSTMESAVISGYNAAEAVMSSNLTVATSPEQQRGRSMG